MQKGVSDGEIQVERKNPGGDWMKSLGCTLKKFQRANLFWGLSLCFLFVSCVAKAPKDYYLHLSAMERAAEEERKESGRMVGEIVVPEESLQPMVIAL